MGVVYHGKKCAAWFNGVAFTNLIGWTSSLTCGTADSTAAHTSNTGRTREAGFKGGTATVTCKASGDAQVNEGDENTLELSRDGTNASKGYAGNAICTGFEHGTDANDVETITYSFLWDDTVTGTITEGSA